MEVGIVGAGLTGLAALHELRVRGVEATCFEAADDPGGVVRSGAIDGVVVEHGPQRVRRSAIVDEYLEAVDLDASLRVADADLPIYVYRDGKLREVPFDLATGIRTDLLSWRGKLRVLGEPFTAGADPEESARSYFVRKLGEEAYRAAIEPLFGGLYASDPGEMPAKYALEPLIRLERRKGSLLRVAADRLRARDRRTPAIVPEGGMGALPARIAERHADAVRLGEPVRAVERAGSRYRLVTATDVVAVDRVVVATPAPAAARLLRGIDGRLAAALSSLRYNPLALAYLRAPVARRGLGYQVARPEGLHTLGVAWNGVAFDRDDLVTAFLGGMHDPEAVEWDDDRLLGVAASELARVLGVDAEPLGVHRVHPGMPAYDRSWSALDDVEAPARIELAGSYTARVGIPGRLAQGRRIAERIVRHHGVPDG